jgi:hypothetical protein
MEGGMTDITTPELAQIAERIRGRIRRTITDIIETGRDLAEVKAKLGHGHFGEWVWNEFNMTNRTAQNYMGAAEWAEDKNEIVSHLSPTIVYALAAPSTPSSVTDRIVADAKAGRPVNDEYVKRHIKSAIEDERKRKRHEREAPVRAVLDAVVEAESEADQQPPAAVDLGRTNEMARLATADHMGQVFSPTDEKVFIHIEDAREIYIAWLLEQPEEVRCKEVKHLFEISKISLRSILNRPVATMKFANRPRNRKS